MTLHSRYVASANQKPSDHYADNLAVEIDHPNAALQKAADQLGDCIQNSDPPPRVKIFDTSSIQEYIIGSKPTIHLLERGFCSS